MSWVQFVSSLQDSLPAVQENLLDLAICIKLSTKELFENLEGSV